MKTFPRLKFCGFTREIDVENAIEAGASAIGLNFVAASKRYVDVHTAARLSHVAAGRVERVGVFANASPDQVQEVLQTCPLDTIQLHGDEDLTWLQGVRQREGLNRLAVLRAVRYRGPEDHPTIAAWSREANDPESPVSAILVDAYSPGHLGGTGLTVRWDLLYPRPQSFFACKVSGSSETQSSSAPMILAGGLDRNNVFQALRIAHPDGIDLASGIESQPGVKDRDAMVTIAAIVRQYFEERSSGKK
ncbi:MAG: phosphoribosylanthranilate isomerase [Planctomycetota bacterium]